MTYVTHGNYEKTEEGLLVGYKLVRADYGSHNRPSFMYAEGVIVDAINLGESGAGLYHCCTREELMTHWDGQYRNDDMPQRLVRLIIDPRDLIVPGRAKRAYVEAISRPFMEWGKFMEEMPAPSMTLEEYAAKPAVAPAVEFPLLPSPQETRTVGDWIQMEADRLLQEQLRRYANTKARMEKVTK